MKILFIIYIEYTIWKNLYTKGFCEVVRYLTSLFKTRNKITRVSQYRMECHDIGCWYERKELGVMDEQTDR